MTRAANAADCSAIASIEVMHVDAADAALPASRTVGGVWLSRVMGCPTDSPLEERSVEQTLDAVELLWLESLEGNCEIFLAAAHYADLCSGEGLPAVGHGRVLPGMERSVRLGGAGTPRVAEFAAAAFGARLRMGAVGGRAMIADALDARHRLPRMYSRVVAREARVPWVRHVARRTRELSLEAAGRVDAEMAELVDGRVPWSRFCAALEGRVVAADPEAAARREEDARREAFARSTRSSAHGMKGFYLRGPAALVIRFEATVAFLAEALKALGDTDDEDQRRVKACLVLANPMQAVELLAAFAAHRSGTGVVDDPLPEDQLPLEDEADEADAGAVPDHEAADAGAVPDDEAPEARRLTTGRVRRWGRWCRGCSGRRSCRVGWPGPVTRPPRWVRWCWTGRGCCRG